MALTVKGMHIKLPAKDLGYTQEQILNTPVMKYLAEHGQPEKFWGDEFNFVMTACGSGALISNKRHMLTIGKDGQCILN